jgi:hypothetical protein
MMWQSFVDKIKHASTVNMQTAVLVDDFQRKIKIRYLVFLSEVEKVLFVECKVATLNDTGLSCV